MSFQFYFPSLICITYNLHNAYYIDTSACLQAYLPKFNLSLAHVIDYHTLVSSFTIFIALNIVCSTYICYTLLKKS